MFQLFLWILYTVIHYFPTVFVSDLISLLDLFDYKMWFSQVTNVYSSNIWRAIKQYAKIIYYKLNKREKILKKIWVRFGVKNAKEKKRKSQKLFSLLRLKYHFQNYLAHRKPKLIKISYPQRSYARISSSFVRNIIFVLEVENDRF